MVCMVAVGANRTRFAVMDFLDFSSVLPEDEDVDISDLVLFDDWDDDSSDVTSLISSCCDIGDGNTVVIVGVSDGNIVDTALPWSNEYAADGCSKEKEDDSSSE